ncbi:MAG: hypothetical protein ACXWHF_03405 [Chthoniobacterales bacterium]
MNQLYLLRTSRAAAAENLRVYQLLPNKIQGGSASFFAKNFRARP